MPETVADGKSVQAITSTLDSIIFPYEGEKPNKFTRRMTFEQRRDEFGCLRRGEDWPLITGDGEFFWRMVYENKKGGGRAINFIYDIKDGTFSVSASELTIPRQYFTTRIAEDAFEQFERRIEQIPLEP